MKNIISSSTLNDNIRKEYLVSLDSIFKIDNTDIDDKESIEFNS